MPEPVEPPSPSVIPGVTPLGTWPVALPDLRVSTDRDFIREGLVHVVAFEYDENAVGGSSGAHPGRPSKWVPVIGFGEVKCRVILKRPSPVDYDIRPGSMRVGKIMFGQAIPADQRNSVLFQEPTFGLLRLYLTGPVIDVHGLGHHWNADVQDRPLGAGQT